MIIWSKVNRIIAVAVAINYMRYYWRYVW